MENKNLPAYPNIDSYETGGTCTPVQMGGLTKLEMVSAMCLQGMLASGYNSDTESNAKWAVENAIALLNHLSNTEK